MTRRVGVIGGGRMGAGIAHAFLLAGYEVVVIERDEAAVRAATARIDADIERSRQRGVALPGGGDRSPGLSTATDAAALSPCELVIEAVPEEPALKLAALRRAEDAVAAGAILATNTSSIPIGELAAALRRPERFVGLHFFNPVPASALVEIVRGAETSEEVVRSATEWVRAIGKTPITVTDSPGFASSRLGLALGLEAIRMLEDGVATAEDIDTAMTLGYRHPLGPLRTTDLVGLDVRLAIAEALHERLGDRFEPPALLRRMVAEGRLGRKSGEGFYRWEN